MELVNINQSTYQGLSQSITIDKRENLLNLVDEERNKKPSTSIFGFGFLSKENTGDNQNFTRCINILEKAKIFSEIKIKQLRQKNTTDLFSNLITVGTNTFSLGKRGEEKKKVDPNSKRHSNI